MNNFTIGIVANTTKPRVIKVLPPFLKWLHKESITFIVASDLSTIIDLSNIDTIEGERIAETCDFVLSFGGDGTFLQTARMIVPHETPIIGINLGEFGYLAEVQVEEIEKRVNDLIQKNFSIQERMMLEVTTGKPVEQTFYALNDVVIDRGGFSRIVKLKTSINDTYLNIFYADGMIVSTPTGSTGYSLSAGGPILDPSIEGIIINPISPHMLANRPLVIADDSIIEIEATSLAGVFLVSVDGQEAMKLDSGRKVQVKRAPCNTKVVVFSDYSFNALLRNKLHWRTRSDNEETPEK